MAIYAGASGNTIGGTMAGTSNVISASVQYYGVYISDSGTTGNVVAGDFIGTDSTGTLALANPIGVYIGNGASDNTIGGTTAIARDVISGNTGDGVHIVNGATGNVVEGDYIGLNASGSAALGNGASGVAIFGGATSNTIGTGDVISGNAGDGVYISDPGTAFNVVWGDDIGTDPTGTLAVPNYDGVVIQNGATYNSIGGSTAFPFRDVISGNTWDGVHVVGSGTSYNVVRDSYIGVTAGGSAALGNGASGVAIYAGASNNTIGSKTAGYGNVISASHQYYGVYISDTGTTGNVVEGDLIGTDSTGTLALANPIGVYIGNGASSNVIGGLTAPTKNVISGNTGDGVQITGSGTSGNVVEGDYVGVTPAVPRPWAMAPAAWPSSAAPAATRSASAISSPATAVTALYLRPGDDPQRRPGGLHRYRLHRHARRAQLLRRGVHRQRGDQQHHRRQHRNLGPRCDLGQQFGWRPNRWRRDVRQRGRGRLHRRHRQRIGGPGQRRQRRGPPSGASSNTIGGTASGSGNVISGNALYGVYLSDSGTNKNVVAGDTIGLSAGGSSAVANLVGVYLGTGATNNTIGTTSTTNGAGGDVIAGNGTGIHLTGSGTINNWVGWCLIGTNASGATGLGNTNDGVLLDSGAFANIIANSVVSYNRNNGIELDNTSASVNNAIQDDTINNNGATGVVLSAASGDAVTACTIEHNGIDGVELESGASGNNVSYSVVSYNGGNGVELDSSTTSGNTIQSDTVNNNQGNGVFLSVASGNTVTNCMIEYNANDGIRLAYGAYGNIISGSVISYNTYEGVELDSSGTSNNAIQSDTINNNGANGVFFNGASGNSVVSCTIENNKFFGARIPATRTPTVTTRSPATARAASAFDGSPDPEPRWEPRSLRVLGPPWG